MREILALWISREKGDMDVIVRKFRETDENEGVFGRQMRVLNNEDQ